MTYIVDGRFKQSNLHPGTVYNPSKTFNGYTLFVPGSKKEALLIDVKGQVVHRWKMRHDIRITAELLPNGNLLCGGMTPEVPLPEISGSAGELVEVNWDGELIWKYEDPYLDAHDWCRTQSGNTLISRFVPIPKDIAAKIKGGIPDTELNGVMWCDALQEITPNGKVVWEWLAYEHIDFDEDVICPLCTRDTWTYINSLEVLPDENILVSFRNIDTIAIIDKTTGHYKWRWGRGEIAHQHTPTLLDNGNILLFDNGLHRRNPVCLSYSRVLEVNPKTNKIEWEYTDPNTASFYSCICSNAQRLPNGNTLICESIKGRILEVTPDKEKVWEYISPYFGYFHRHNIGWSNMMYRAYRYGPDYEGLKGRALDPGRFEWIFREKGKPVTEEIQEGAEPSQEEKVLSRLKKLGY